MYGGIALLGILTKNSMGLASESIVLDDTQWALFRAGHAHAGVWLVLALVIQVLDSATLSSGLKWLARIAAEAEPDHRWMSEVVALPIANSQ